MFMNTNTNTSQTANGWTAGAWGNNIRFQFTQPPPRTLHLRVHLPQNTPMHHAQMADFIQRLQTYFNAGCPGPCPEPAPLERFMDDAAHIIEGEVVRGPESPVAAVVPCQTPL